MCEQVAVKVPTTGVGVYVGVCCVNVLECAVGMCWSVLCECIGVWCVNVLECAV